MEGGKEGGIDGRDRWEGGNEWMEGWRERRRNGRDEVDE